MFGVTTDAGATWSFKGGIENPAIVMLDPYAGIESVVIDADGTGEMQLTTVAPDHSLRSHRFVTTDVGESWVAE